MFNNSGVERPVAPQPRPTCGLDIARAVGVAPDEGVVIALLPAQINRVTMREVPVLDKKGNRMFVVEADIPFWGVRLLDLVSDREPKVKWWRVREVASQERMDTLPIRWEGPVAEIPERYFREGNVLAVRFYKHGPWFWPNEKPVVLDEKAEQEMMSEAIPSVR